jgi:hypothetical protein
MTDTAMPAAPLGQWSVVDLFGRQRAAGYLTEVKVAGQDFLRLDIPASNGHQARTIHLNPSAVYSWEAIDEETARLVAAMDAPPSPVSVWSARRMVHDSGSQLAIDAPDDESYLLGEEVTTDE